MAWWVWLIIVAVILIGGLIALYIDRKSVV